MEEPMDLRPIAVKSMKAKGSDRFHRRKKKKKASPSKVLFSSCLQYIEDWLELNCESRNPFNLLDDFFLQMIVLFSFLSQMCNGDDWIFFFFFNWTAHHPIFFFKDTHFELWASFFVSAWLLCGISQLWPAVKPFWKFCNWLFFDKKCCHCSARGRLLRRCCARTSAWLLALCASWIGRGPSWRRRRRRLWLTSRKRPSLGKWFCRCCYSFLHLFLIILFLFAIGCGEDHGEGFGEDQEVCAEVLWNEDATPGCWTSHSGQHSPSHTCKFWANLPSVLFLDS